MPASKRDYFGSLMGDERMLREHGFAGWPDSDSILRYACGIEDGLRTLASAVGVSLSKDPRGNWHAVPRTGGRGA